MKVRCGYCGEVFDYEESKKVCPNCKRFSVIPEDNEEQKKPEKMKPKKENKKEQKKEDEENKKIAPEIVEDENGIVEDAQSKRASKKNLYAIIALFLIIVILPIFNSILSADPSEKLKGPTGTIISTQVASMYLSEILEEEFIVEQVGYTNKGYLYVVYESNIKGFVDNGYEIKFYVADADGVQTLLGCLRSDFATIYGPEFTSYKTKAIFNYTNEDPRIVKLIITSNDKTIGSLSF